MQSMRDCRIQIILFNEWESLPVMLGRRVVVKITSRYQNVNNPCAQHPPIHRAAANPHVVAELRALSLLLPLSDRNQEKAHGLMRCTQRVPPFPSIIRWQLSPASIQEHIVS